MKVGHAHPASSDRPRLTSPCCYQDKEIEDANFTTEIRAGLTTFATMANIIAVNVRPSVEKAVSLPSWIDLANGARQGLHHGGHRRTLRLPHQDRQRPVSGQRLVPSLRWR